MSRAGGDILRNEAQSPSTRSIFQPAITSPRRSLSWDERRRTNHSAPIFVVEVFEGLGVFFTFSTNNGWSVLSAP